MGQTYLVLRAVPYNMVDDVTKRVNAGVTLMVSDGMPLDHHQGKGWNVIKLGALPTVERQIREVPAFYDLDLKVKTAKNKMGQDIPSVQATGAHYVGPFELTEESALAGRGGVMDIPADEDVPFYSGVVLESRIA